MTASTKRLGIDLRSKETNSRADRGVGCRERQRFLGIGGWMVVLACFLAAACSDAAGPELTAPVKAEPPAPAVSDVVTNPSSLTLDVGEATEIALEIVASDGSTLNRSASWRVVDPSVAELSGGGSSRRVEGLAPGSTQVIASVDGFSDTTRVEVRPSEPTPAAVSSVELSPRTLSVKEGATGEITMEAKAADGSTLDVLGEWTVESPSRVKLMGEGRKRRVKGLKPGKTRVVATVEGVADTSVVEVTKPEPTGPTVATVRLSPSSLSLTVGATRELSVEVKASDGSMLNRQADWKVGDGDVARLGGGGSDRAVEGLAAGATTVVATVDGVADTADVEVVPAPSPPGMPSQVSVSETGRTDMAIEYRAEWGASEGADRYEWEAGSEAGRWSDASETGGRRATFEAPRSDADDQSYFCVRAVNDAGESEQRCTDLIVPATSASGESGGSGGGASDTTVASVIVLPETPSIQVGGTVQLTGTTKNADGDVVSASLTWSSLDPAVATVSGSGLVTGQADGTTGIVAVTDGIADTATVTVTAGSSGGGGSGGGPAVVFDPDLYSSTQELKDDPYGVFSSTELGGNYHLDTQVGYPGGSHSMRYDYVDQGVDNPIHLGRDIPIGQRVKEVWIEVDLRWSSNFLDIQNPPNTQGWTFAHKLIFAAARTQNAENWLTSEGYSVGRWGFMWPGGGGNNPPHGTVLMETPVHDDGSHSYVHAQGFDVASMFDGQWHTVRLHFRHDPGLYEFFVDGVRIGAITGFTVHPEVAITNILLGRNKDDGIESGTESLWWGKMKIWTQDPGW